jgi:RNA polymerase sigma-70 factor (ECF subfamily)
LTKHQNTEQIAEERLWIEAAKKNPQHFNKLYEKYFEDIFHFIFRRVNDEDVAADICSKAFLKALNNLKKYEFRGLPFSAWLYRIASNEVNRHYRETSKTVTFSLEEPIIKQLIDTEDDDLKEERLEMLTKYLEKINTKEMVILQLRFFEDKSFKEIAYILEISESGAKMRLYRTLEKLKSFFKK